MAVKIKRQTQPAKRPAAKAQADALDAFLKRYEAEHADFNWLFDFEKGIIALEVGDENPTWHTKASGEFEVKSLNLDEKLYIKGIANAAEIDRTNEILIPAGLVSGPFNKNPVLLLGHNHDKPVGQVVRLQPEVDGVHFEAWIGDPKAAPLTDDQLKARSLVAQRIFRAVSVGFIPLKIRMPAYNDMGELVDPAKIEEWEILELSLVAVPCNAGSLFEVRDAGGTPKALKEIPTFLTVGKDGKLVITKQETTSMDKELLAALQGIKTGLDALGTGVNSLLDGQKELASHLKGKKPPKDDEEDDDEDKKALKAEIKALADRCTKMEATVANVEAHVEKALAAIESQTKTLEILVEKLPAA